MSKFWTRQTGNTVPSIMENALPFIELGMKKRAQKQQEEDYGLRRKWEEEDRALNRQRQIETDALAKEEREYQRGRDTKADMWNLETKTESARRWDIEQKDKTDRNKMEVAYRDKIERLQQKSEDVKKTNPMLAMEIDMYKDTWKLYSEAVRDQDTEGAAKLKTQLEEQSKRLNALMPKEAGNVGQGGNADLELAPNPVRERLQATKDAGKPLGLEVMRINAEREGKPIPQAINAPSVQKLAELIKAGGTKKILP